MSKELASTRSLSELVNPNRAIASARPLLEGVIPVRHRIVEVPGMGAIVRPPAYPQRLRRELPELLVASGTILGSKEPLSRRNFLRGMFIGGAVVGATMSSFGSVVNATERLVTRVHFEPNRGRVSNVWGPMSDRKEGPEATGINPGGAADQHDAMFKDFWGFDIKEIYAEGTRDFLTRYFSGALSSAGEDGWEYRGFCAYASVNNNDGPLNKRTSPVLGRVVDGRIQGILMAWMYEKSRYHALLDPNNTQQIEEMLSRGENLIANYASNHQSWWGAMNQVQSDGTFRLTRYQKWDEPDGTAIYEYKSPAQIKELVQVNSSFALSSDQLGGANTIVDPVIVQLAAGMLEPA